MLGGGTFLTQNKTLPGAYINFVSVARASNIFGDRGRAAVALALDWGADGITTVDPADLQKDALRLFGYPFTAPELRPIREVLSHARTVYVGRLNGKGVKASATVGNLTATARYAGTRGNAIQIVISNDIDTPGNFVVKTLLDGMEVSKASSKTVEELPSNEFVVFSGTGDLATNAGTLLENGTNSEVNGLSHTTFLEELEKLDFNTVGYAGTDDAVKTLYVSFIKRLRDIEGVKSQLVVYQKDADHEGVVNLGSKTTDAEEASLVYWLTGASAGCEVNRSLTNVRYDGEYTLDTSYKQRELEEALKKGRLVFHQVGGEVRVLSDVNSFVSFTAEKNDDFGQNQVIRVLDQIARDCSVIFNTRYLGKVQNNTDGRMALWNDFVRHAETLQKIGAVEGFKATDIVVEKGFSKNAVAVEYTVQPVMAMEKLYMIVRVA